MTRTDTPSRYVAQEAALLFLELRSLPPAADFHALPARLARARVAAHAALMSATAGFAGAVQSCVFVMRRNVRGYENLVHDVNRFTSDANRFASEIIFLIVRPSQTARPSAARRAASPLSGSCGRARRGRVSDCR